MKDYKVIQIKNNLLIKEGTHQQVFGIDEDDVSIIHNSIKYFSQECFTLSYPSKSYCVAIIYSHLLTFYFGENFLECLCDESLLCHNDDHFISYQKAKHIYDEILAGINYSADFKLNLELSQVKSSVDYFMQEFEAEPSTYLKSLQR